ncbi:MAG TPA: glutathione S-transferase family protein [Ghiorsea sp.]|nr:glutathione S-transferase family protein [Ghiorsea sp.]HIP07914.1 glutathione S-transferase family protein [Mariprofundaceae bacterium]
MGLLVEGKWVDQWYDTKDSGGKFVRKDSSFRSWIGGADGVFPAEAGRYHLYVSLACPWAHRALIFRQLKGLADLIDVTVVSPDMLDKGWTFQPKSEPLYGYQYAHQLYTHAQADYTGRVVVPILWDKKKQTIVSNESSEIIRMFNSAFDSLTGNTDDYYPEDLRSAIDEVNEDVYHSINNGVYKVGFATTQEAYDEAFDALFAGLDRVEERLASSRYLVGGSITEADWRLFTTLIRFDAVYFGHFKCNKKQIADCPNMYRYLKDLYAQSNIKGTVHIEHIKRHYYYSHESINPTRIVPQGLPEIFG